MGASNSTQRNSRNRILIHELDSLRQSEIFQDTDDLSEFIAAEVGVVRTGILLASEVLVTDSDVLDGIFFLMIGPKELALRLGAPGARVDLCVIGRAPTLRESLLQMLELGTDMLWQTGTVLAETANWSPERIALARAAWVDAEESGAISYRQGDPRPADMVTSKLGTAPRSDSQYIEWTNACRSSNRRSAIFVRLGELEKAWAGADGQSLRREFMDWWNRAYLDGEADLYNASWLTFDRRSAFPEARGGIESGGGLKRLAISGTLLDQMTQMPPSMYAEILYLLRSHRERYWQLGRRTSLIGLAYGITKLTEVTSRARFVLVSWLRIALATVGLGLALLGSELERNGPVLQVLALAMIALVSLPYSELHALTSVRRQRMTGVISISTAD